MWYPVEEANTLLCAPAHGGRAGHPGGRSPVDGRLDRTPMPDPPRQCRGAVNPPSARHRHGTDQPVRHALHPCQQRGLAALPPPSSRPPTVSILFDTGAGESLRALLHQSPRPFGKPTSRWTLALAAEVSFAQGLTPRLVSDDTMRLARRRWGGAWQRATHGITSPDPAYRRENNGAIACSSGP
jgi:hypothetical protein